MDAGGGRGPGRGLELVEGAREGAADFIHFHVAPDLLSTGWPPLHERGEGCVEESIC